MRLRCAVIICGREVAAGHAVYRRVLAVTIQIERQVEAREQWTRAAMHGVVRAVKAGKAVGAAARRGAHSRQTDQLGARYSYSGYENAISVVSHRPAKPSFDHCNFVHVVQHYPLEGLRHWT